MKVGINGFGRIGRDVARILLEGKHPDLELVHINASGNLDDLAHLFKYDSLYGKLPHEKNLNNQDYTQQDFQIQDNLLRS